MTSESREKWFAHPTACIDDDVEVGEGSRIWHFSHVMSGARIGRGCSMGQNVVISPRVVIGDNVKMQNNVSVYTGVTLEDDVFCGPSMVFTNVSTPRSGTPRNRPEDFLPTLVKRGATIGANATIVCGVTLGRYAFVGAGAVVTKDVPDFAVVVGNPARIHGFACECGVKLPLKASDTDVTVVCADCGRGYEKQAGGVSQKSGPARRPVAGG